VTAHDTPLTRDEQLLSIPAPGVPASPYEDEVWIERVRVELETGFEALAGVERGVTVFGSARTQREDPDYELARAATRRLGGQGYAIITGGGPGIMEAANHGARDAGTLSVGMPIELPVEESVNRYLDLCVRFHFFFTRKVMFVRYASAFVIFPGGFGTFDELFELVTLIQTRKIRSPPVVLVRRSYWEPVLAWLHETVLASGKISPKDLGLIALAEDVDEIVAGVQTTAGRI
jgi:uncharacterized protein (TIGR00730 family)